MSINKKAFDSCKLILDENTKETIIRLYFCENGFIETSEKGNSFEIKSYGFGYSKKIDL